MSRNFKDTNNRAVPKPSRTKDTVQKLRTVLIQGQLEPMDYSATIVSKLILSSV